jgi:hypothetical protein
MLGKACKMATEEYIKIRETKNMMPVNVAWMEESAGKMIRYVSKFPPLVFQAFLAYSQLKLWGIDACILSDVGTRRSETLFLKSRKLLSALLPKQLQNRPCNRQLQIP